MGIVRAGGVVPTVGADGATYIFKYTVSNPYPVSLMSDKLNKSPHTVVLVGIFKKPAVPVGTNWLSTITLQVLVLLIATVPLTACVAGKLVTETLDAEPPDAAPTVFSEEQNFTVALVPPHVPLELSLSC